MYFGRKAAENFASKYVLAGRAAISSKRPSTKYDPPRQIAQSKYEVPSTRTTGDLMTVVPSLPKPRTSMMSTECRGKLSQAAPDFGLLWYTSTAGAQPPRFFVGIQVRAAQPRAIYAE